MTGSVPLCPFPVLATWERGAVVPCPPIKGMRQPDPRKMLQRNKVCTLFFEEVPGVETGCSGRSWPRRRLPLPGVRAGYRPTGTFGEQYGGPKRSRWPSGRRGTEPELGRPREPPPCAPLHLLPRAGPRALAATGETGAGQGEAEGPLSPRCHLG